MFSESEAGLERALRLFPLRTGLAVPDWIVVGEGADSMGMGGVEAAGYVRHLHCRDFTSQLTKSLAEYGVTSGPGTGGCHHSKLR